MKALPIKRSRATVLLIIFVSFLTACFCSSCCCYCDTQCTCQKLDANGELENITLLKQVDGECDTKTQCLKACINAGWNFVSYNPDYGFGCYESNCLLSQSLGGNDPRFATIIRFRDEVLSQTKAGREIIDLYYQHQDEMVTFLEKHPEFQKSANALIDLVVPVMKTMLEKKGKVGKS